MGSKSDTAEKNNFRDRLVERTEQFLTWRKRHRLIKKEKQKRKNPILDWVDAILSAVVIVLLINQYLLQAYLIPSQSMIPTLLIGDRIFVNKIIYGPELIPGRIKLPGFRQPKRGEVIIFDNPDYLSPGPVKEILQRIIYMVTLTLVDIDKDEYGRPKHHFLIKRAIGMPGDRIRMRNGNVEILMPGEQKWITEKELKGKTGLRYPVRRMFQKSEYPDFKQAAVGIALENNKLAVNDEIKNSISKYFINSNDSTGHPSFEQKALVDSIYIWKWMYRTEYQINPANRLAREKWRIEEQGQYIPENRIFPMGDNRDDSRDARYFGPVPESKILGKAAFRFWPLPRFGDIR